MNKTESSLIAEFDQDNQIRWQLIFNSFEPAVPKKQMFVIMANPASLDGVDVTTAKVIKGLRKHFSKIIILNVIPIVTSSKSALQKLSPKDENLCEIEKENREQITNLIRSADDKDEVLIATGVLKGTALKTGYDAMVDIIKQNVNDYDRIKVIDTLDTDNWSKHPAIGSFEYDSLQPISQCSVKGFD